MKTYNTEKLTLKLEEYATQIKHSEATGELISGFTYNVKLDIAEYNKLYNERKGKLGTILFLIISLLPTLFLGLLWILVALPFIVAIIMFRSWFVGRPVNKVVKRLKDYEVSIDGVIKKYTKI